MDMPLWPRDDTQRDSGLARHQRHREVRMSWHRDQCGLWCACFITYQPDNGTGCPAHPCPENTYLTRLLTEEAGK